METSFRKLFLLNNTWLNYSINKLLLANVYIIYQNLSNLEIIFGFPVKLTFWKDLCRSTA